MDTPVQNPGEDQKDLFTGKQYQTDDGSLFSQFCLFLEQHNYHLGRADLPRGKSPSDQLIRRRTLKRWKKALADLVSGIGRDRVEKVMRWYFQHHRDPYVRTCLSLTTFVQSFFSIEKAMMREELRKERDESRSARRGRGKTNR